MLIQPNLYSLLFVNSEKRKHSNLDSGESDPLDIYLMCGINLRNSCNSAGLSFAIITNDANALGMRLAALGEKIDIFEIYFARDVPLGIPFYEAHYKLDVIKELGSGRYGEIVALVDLDAVVTRNIEVSPISNDLFVYDLTAIQERSYGASVIANNLVNSGAIPNAARWFGGEFVMAHATIFAELAGKIDECWPIYLSNLSDMHHIGDEAVVSAAISRLENINVIDLGTASSPPSVVRYWSARTRHKPDRLGSSLNASVVHLPADKKFLASLSQSAFNVARFRTLYMRRLRRISFTSNILYWIQEMMGRRNVRFPPQI